MIPPPFAAKHGKPNVRDNRLHLAPLFPLPLTLPVSGTGKSNIFQSVASASSSGPAYYLSSYLLVPTQGLPYETPTNALEFFDPLTPYKNLGYFWTPTSLLLRGRHILMHPLLNMSPPSEQNETQRSDKSDGAPFFRADGLFVSRIRALRPRVSIREERRGEEREPLSYLSRAHVTFCLYVSLGWKSSRCCH